MFGRCIVLLLLCGLSIGFSQMIRSKHTCGMSDRFSRCYDTLRHGSRLYCPDHHVFLIADFSVLAFNETDERTCCARTPRNSCSADFNNSLPYRTMTRLSRCPLSSSCYFYEYYMMYGLVNMTNDCSATNFMFRLDYTCVTNSTIVNMTRPGVNTSMGEISLSYSRGKYPYFPKINESFFCSCEVTSPDDVAIYPTIFSLLFNVNRKYNTSLFIYSRKWNVSYDRDNYNVLDLYLSNKYRRLNETVGPIYVVYTGKELPTYDTVWINFKVLEGKLRTRCDGCKRGKHYPPTFEGNVKGSGVNGNGNGQSLEVSKKHATRDSANGFKIAFIILMVIMAILGVAVIIGFLCWRKRRKEQKSDQKGVTEPHLQGGGRERGRGRGREKSTATGRANTRGKGANRGNEVSQPAVVSEVYDKIDRSQPSVVYDNLVMENIYDN